MKSKKTIDKLYQKKFRDVETTPREDVWKNISGRLPEKGPEKRVLPLWYKLAGIAAVFALLISFGLFKTLPEQKIKTASTQQTKEVKELDVTSAAYKENMLISSIILEALIQKTKITQLKEQLKTEIKKESSGKAVFAGIINPEVPVLSGSGYSYTFSKHNNLRQPEEKEATQGSEGIPILTNEEKITEEEDIKEKIAPSKRLSLTTTAAAIYFDNMGNGNTLDAQFSDNESKGQVSFSYGINVSYQISDKIKIRSGINKVAISNNTEDIAFDAAVSSAALDTELQTVIFASPVTRQKGQLHQKMGFIEVPVEVEYALINKKIGLNIIGGASTFFLDENRVFLNYSDFSTDLGQANNLNNLSFSTNIGIGIDYNISPRFKLNLEPIFKYQINTFNNTSSVNPYFFGVYSGFSFKF